MCELCHRANCKSDCPNFKPPRNGTEVGRCVLCGEPIGADRGYYRMHGFPYCEACLEDADSETLIRICETSRREWLKKMGFYYLKADTQEF